MLKIFGEEIKSLKFFNFKNMIFNNENIIVSKTLHFGAVRETRTLMD